LIRSVIDVGRCVLPDNARGQIYQAEEERVTADARKSEKTVLRGFPETREATMRISQIY